MARIKWTKKDVIQAFEDALAEGQGQTVTPATSLDRIRQAVLKNKGLPKLPKV